MIDVVVVGSGASAVHAAWPLVMAGLRVTMVDVGEHDKKYHDLIPAKSFEEIRLTDPDQHRYFLGDEFEGIPFGPVRVGAQLTPPRQHISRLPSGALPIETDEFHAMQSLAVGGLAAGWGAATPHYLDKDIDGWPITRTDLQPHYDAVTKRVGICGAEDDLEPFFGPSPGLLESPKIDSNAVCIYKKYRRKSQKLNRRGFYMGESRLAMVTRPKRRRRGPGCLSACLYNRAIERKIEF